MTECDDGGNWTCVDDEAKEGTGSAHPMISSTERDGRTGTHEQWKMESQRMVRDDMGREKRKKRITETRTRKKKPKRHKNQFDRKEVKWGSSANERKSSH